MRRLETRRSAIPVLVALVLAGAVAVLPAAAKKKDDGDDPDKLIEFTRDGARGEVDADKALVYVMRPASVGVLVKTWAFVDDEVVGANKASSYFYFQAEPGTRTIWSKMENVDALELELEAGQTYYLMQHLRMGWTKARTKLELLDEKKGLKVLGRCKKRATLTSAGEARGAELVVESREELQRDLDRDAER